MTTAQSPHAIACVYCKSSNTLTFSRSARTRALTRPSAPPMSLAFADIPSAFSAALKTNRGALGIPIKPFNLGSNKSSQSRGGFTPFGSLSFLYAITAHPNLYGAP